MSPILMRCRDADMMGPLCDVVSEDKPLTDTIREMRVNAAIQNEPEITDSDIDEIEELMRGGEECCCEKGEYCC